MDLDSSLCLNVTNQFVNLSFTYVRKGKMSGEVASPATVIAEYACNLEKKQRNLLKRKVSFVSFLIS